MLYYCYVLHIPIHTPLYHTHSLYVLIQKDLAANITDWNKKVHNSDNNEYKHQQDCSC